PVYLDTWIENSNTFYTARTRGQDVRQALLSLMQAQYAADLQDLAFNGDESSSDAFVKLNDGYIKMAKASAEVKVEGTKLPTIQELTAATARIEPKYLRQGTFKFFMSQATATNYVVELQNRNTALGDAVLVDGALRNIGGFGVEVVESMENNVILFTPYENLAVVSGLTVTLTTAAQDSRAVAKQATYH
ncbi:phage capsid protein, partial [Klebsiella pneumoniae]